MKRIALFSELVQFIPLLHPTVFAMANAKNPVLFLVVPWIPWLKNVLT